MEPGVTANSSPTEDALTLWWRRHYNRRPRLMILLTLLFGISFLALILVGRWYEVQEERARRKQILDYETQLSEMDKLEASLRNLTEFVGTQRTRLKESETLIATLKTEQQRLTPFVEADRRVVKAVLDLQAQEARSYVWRERWIGFGIGVLSSILASALYGFFAPLATRRGKRAAAQPSDGGAGGS